MRVWSSTLRNALAHGGIAYLDGNGRSSFDGSPVKMYAFASWKYRPRNGKQRPRVNLLRIREEDYRDFLGRWVDWLKEIGYAVESRAA
jgi:hypothetical protein